jgi:hypothetical protein
MAETITFRAIARKRPMLVAAVALTVPAIFSLSAFAPLSANTAGGPLSLCGNPGPAPAAIQHVVVVMLENLSYKQVVGNANALFGLPYLAHAVQVSVDNGTPQLASGTTSWTASIDTTALTNGTHTIDVQATDTDGNVGTASITVTVSNTSTVTSCPATPAGAAELSGNVSLETRQAVGEVGHAQVDGDRAGPCVRAAADR